MAPYVSLSCLQKKPVLVPVMNNINPVNNFSSYFPKTYFNIVPPSTPSSYKFSLPSGFSDKNCVFHISYMCATCHSHLILLDLINIIILHDLYNSWRSSLCSLFQPLTTFSLIGRDILLNTLFSKTINLLPLVWHTSFYVLIFKFSRAAEKTSIWTEWQSAYPKFICS
jgi:hypothetical protein